MSTVASRETQEIQGLTLSRSLFSKMYCRLGWDWSICTYQLHTLSSLLCKLPKMLNLLRAWQGQNSKPQQTRILTILRDFPHIWNILTITFLFFCFLDSSISSFKINTRSFPLLILIEISSEVTISFTTLWYSTRTDERKLFWRQYEKIRDFTCCPLPCSVHCTSELHVK